MSSPILNIRFVGAKIRHRVWSPGARGLLDGEGMNRNSGLTTLSDSSIALSEDEKKAGEGQGSKKLQEFDGLGTKKKKVVTIIILHS